MTVQEFAGGINWPEPLGASASNMDATSNMTLDAAGEKAAMIFQIPRDGTVIGASFTTNAVSVTAGPLTFTVTIETLDVSGNPSGTLIDVNATVTQAIATTDDDKMFNVTFTGFTVNGGDVVALVVTAPGAGTFDVDIAAGRTINISDFPYTNLFTASWADFSNVPIMALEYSGGVYHNVLGAYPIETTVNTVFSSSSTPDERGAKFQLPGPIQITGGWMRVDADDAFDLVLYDSGSTAQLTHSHVSGHRVGTARGMMRFMFDGTFELAANTVARIVAKPTTPSNIGATHFTTSSAAHMDGFGGGQNFHLTTRTDAGAWTDTTTAYPVIGIIFNGIGDDAGGGGGTDSILGAGGLHGGFA